MNRTTNNILIYSIWTAIYLTLLVPLVVSVGLYFPFVTGKAHAFRILVEISLCLYRILVMRNKSYLPKRNLLLWSVVGFTAVLGLATIFAESPYRAFWSNFERMEGYVMILHLFALFIIASSVFRGRKAWTYLLNTTLFVSIVVGFYGFKELGEGAVRIAGTLGNSSYLGVYALLHAFIGGLLMMGFLKHKHLHKKEVSLYSLLAVVAMGIAVVAFYRPQTFGPLSAYILALEGLAYLGCAIAFLVLKNTKFALLTYIPVVLFNIVVLYQTGTRGSFAGLAVGVLLIALLLAILERGMKRKLGIGLLVATVVIVGFFGSFKNAGFIKNNDLLYRFSSLITFDVKSVAETQGEARLILWNMALRGVQERPIIGWGQDNFSYVFAKYYDPKMYAQEQWFDRTHDVFFDWLISGGILALLGYLSLFYAVLYLLWKGPKGHTGDKEWSITEKSIFTGMLAAYFVHNIFVFDNLSSYIIFFLLLSYVAERYNEMAHPHSHEWKPLVTDTFFQAMIATVVVILTVTSAYFVVYKPYMAGEHLIMALQPNLVGQDKKPLSPELAATYRLGEMNAALSYNTFGDTEIRERLTDIAGDAFAQMAGNGPSLPDVVKNLDTLVATQYKQQLEQFPNDARSYVFYAMYLQKIGAYSTAIPYVTKASSLSPTKQSFLLEKGTLEMAAGKNDQALITLKSAYDLEPRNTEVGIIYAAGLVYAGKFDEAKAFMSDKPYITEDTRVIQSYFAKGKYAEVVDLIKRRIAENPTDGQMHMSLAGVYLKMKQSANAISEIRQAMKLAPQFTQLGNYYIKEIQAGRDPSSAPQPTQQQLDAANKK